MKKALYGILSLVVIGVLYFGYSKYEEHKLISVLTPIVKNSSLRVNNALRYEFEEDANITVGELFEKLGKDVSEIDQKIIELQTISNDHNKNLTKPSIEYLQISQSFLRALSFKFRKTLDANAAHKRSIEIATMGLFDGTRRYAIDNLEKSTDDFIAAVHERAKAEEDFYETSKKLIAMQSNLVKHYTADALVDIAKLEVSVKKYEQNRNAHKDEKKS